MCKNALIDSQCEQKVCCTRYKARKSIQFSLQLLSARVFLFYLLSPAALPRHFAGRARGWGVGGGSGWEDVRHLVCHGMLSMQLTQSVQTPALCPYILFQQNFSFHSQRVRASLAAKELLKWQICTVMQGSSSSNPTCERRGVLVAGSGLLPGR